MVCRVLVTVPLFVERRQWVKYVTDLGSGAADPDREYHYRPSASNVLVFKISQSMLVACVVDGLN